MRGRSRKTWASCESSASKSGRVLSDYKLRASYPPTSPSFYRQLSAHERKRANIDVHASYIFETVRAYIDEGAPWLVSGKKKRKNGELMRVSASAAQRRAIILFVRRHVRLRAHWIIRASCGTGVPRIDLSERKTKKALLLKNRGSARRETRLPCLLMW